MELSSEQITQFQTKILNWYKEHKRNLPWRKTKDPYKIHVSEIMLQQTQVERVIDYFERFLKKYPTVVKLAQAQKEDLLILWQGLGYNNRVLRLQQSAQEIVEHYDGIYPQDRDCLLALPGVGPYTASAILAFAFNKEVPVVDTNVRRILIHEFNLSEELKEKDLEELATALVPSGLSRDYHNALMDYGATFLTAKKTGIQSTSKQGKFEGSTRWVRSQVLKQLLEKKELEMKLIIKQFPDHDVKKILEGMQRDGMLRIKTASIQLV